MNLAFVSTEERKYDTRQCTSKNVFKMAEIKLVDGKITFQHGYRIEKAVAVMDCRRRLWRVLAATTRIKVTASSGEAVRECEMGMKQTSRALVITLWPVGGEGVLPRCCQPPDSK